MIDTATVGVLAAAAVANTGLLTAIFFRLGGLATGHDEHGRRIGKIETKLEGKQQ